MNIPCSTPPAACPAGTDGDDALIANASVETPDVRMFFGYRYSLRSSNFCEATTQVAADLCALNPPDAFDSDTIYSSRTQTCIIDCSGSPVSYTVPNGVSLGLTQAAADAAAYNLACIGAAIVCGGGSGTLIPNEAQACSVTCEDGSVVTGVIPAGSVMAFSLAEANASAYAIACQAAASQCPNNPPPTFGNVALSSTSNCPEGGSFTFVVPANTFFAASQAEANATAQSYADQQAVLQRSCLGNISDAVCAQSLYSALLTSDITKTITWSITSGSLPAGITFSDGNINGVPTVPGVSTFTVQALGTNGNYSTRTYSITVASISTAALTDASAGAAYSFTLTQSGATSPVWSASGLPSGLSLDAATGVISGVPVAQSSSSVTITMSFGNSGLCSKPLTLVVTLFPLEWWKLDQPNITPRIGSLNGIALQCTANVTSVAGGKYGNATSLNATQSTDSLISNLSVPVTGLAYTGNGIDVFFWMHIPAVPSSDSILLINFADASGVTLWSMGFTVDNLVGIEYVITGGSGGVSPLATSPNYRLFQIYYDPSLSRLGCRVNNGADFDAWVTIGGAVKPAAAKGALSITHDRKQAGSSADEICELAVYPGVLNATQRAYVFNSGNGQTWPNTLP